ncbi:TetR family transcriptional regulator [Paraliobacillus quinghaiensis]|uniref:TetR family transcriptional regulator n=1 Tax=Paraliobacillus quinghaiensis TaxID=470815 RepID=A0A917TS39_9BACI|nr:TetR/AcrR family transcriptional regulator [Paraliobacillus quinghaiensis]GGM32385.1 TetR family transcriptional regulator [Paraliobacillus quinghaiensis]
MNEKKQRIIEESMKLFAEKGYHATSIQEIAKRSEVSKGAFYLYFNSKEELTVGIFEYYTSMVMSKVEAIQIQQDKDPKTKLVEQIKMFFDLLTNHKEYVMMHFRDNLQVGNQIDALVIKLNKQGFRWMQTSINEIYGEKTDPYIVDISVQIDGLLQGYFKSIVMHDLHIDTGSLASFVVDRIDDLINGMLRSNATPQLTIDQLSYGFAEDAPLDTIQKLVADLLEEIDDLELSIDQKKQLKEAINMITNELAKEEKNHVILQGMLTQVATMPSLQPTSKKIADLLGVELAIIEKENEGDH